MTRTTTSLTPMADMFEAGIAKMEADMAKMAGSSETNQVGLRLSRAILPPLMRAFAKEMDAGTAPEEVMHGLAQTIANGIASVIGSTFAEEDKPAAAGVLLHNLVICLRPRLKFGDLPDNAKFDDRCVTPQGGHA